MLEGIGEAIQPFDHHPNAPIIARDSAQRRISHVRKVGYSDKWISAS
jgi:hypothetical protein